MKATKPKKGNGTFCHPKTVIGSNVHSDVKPGGVGMGGQRRTPRFWQINLGGRDMLCPPHYYFSPIPTRFLDLPTALHADVDPGQKSFVTSQTVWEYFINEASKTQEKLFRRCFFFHWISWWLKTKYNQTPNVSWSFCSCGILKKDEARLSLFFLNCDNAKKLLLTFDV